MRKNRKYTPEFKIKCVKEVLEGEKSVMTMIKTKYCKWEWTFAVDTFNNEIIASSVSRKIGNTRTYIEVAKQVAEKALFSSELNRAFLTNFNIGTFYCPLLLDNFTFP